MLLPVVYQSKESLAFDNIGGFFDNDQMLTWSFSEL